MNTNRLIETLEAMARSEGGPEANEVAKKMTTEQVQARTNNAKRTMEIMTRQLAAYVDEVAGDHPNFLRSGMTVRAGRVNSMADELMQLPLEDLMLVSTYGDWVISLLQLVKSAMDVGFHSAQQRHLEGR